MSTSTARLCFTIDLLVWWRFICHAHHALNWKWPSLNGIIQCQNDSVVSVARKHCGAAADAHISTWVVAPGAGGLVESCWSCLDSIHTSSTSRVMEPPLTTGAGVIIINDCFFGHQPWHYRSMCTLRKCPTHQNLPKICHRPAISALYLPKSSTTHEQKEVSTSSHSDITEESKWRRP